MINAFFYQQGAYYHQPTNMVIAFEPQNAPKHSVVMFTYGSCYEFDIGSHSPLLEMLKCRFTNEKKKGDAIRELGYHRGTKLVRMVRVMTDPRWDLCLIGDQQPFEERKSYEKIKGKRIKDYFTQEDMIRFATNWGCPIGEDDFWDSDQPMYCWGELENDKDLADWTEWPDGFVLPDA